jgi:hypothetical protein
LAVDSCLRQLPDLLYEPPEVKMAIVKPPSAVGFQPLLLRAGRIGQNQAAKRSDKPLNYVPNRFLYSC